MEAVREADERGPIALSGGKSGRIALSGGECGRIALSGAKPGRLALSGGKRGGIALSGDGLLRAWGPAELRLIRFPAMVLRDQIPRADDRPARLTGKNGHHGAERRIAGVALHDGHAAGKFRRRRVHRQGVDPGKRVQFGGELLRAQYPQPRSGAHQGSVCEVPARWHGRVLSDPAATFERKSKRVDVLPNLCSNRSRGAYRQSSPGCRYGRPGARGSASRPTRAAAEGVPWTRVHRRRRGGRAAGSRRQPLLSWSPPGMAWPTQATRPGAAG